MIQLGKRQKLQVLKRVDFGVYLGEPAQTDVQEKVLLPIKQVPEQTKEGDILEVFIYKIHGPDDCHCERTRSPGGRDSCPEGSSDF